MKQHVSSRHSGQVVDIRDDAGLRVARVRFAGISHDVCLAAAWRPRP